jgi:hypothetical protein
MKVLCGNLVYPKNNFLPFFAGLLINLKTSAG